VIGDPGCKDPHLNKSINRLISHIQKNHKLPIVRVDESLTSVAANNELQEFDLSLDKKVAMRDQIAACIILETHLNQLS
jgi:RNase H-fold protein (predicted Holliday junction resolvase)